MVVGPPLVDAIFSVGVLVSVAMTPLICMAAADAALSAARREHRRRNAPSNCCFDAAGYDDSGSDEEEEEEARRVVGDAAAAHWGLRQRVTAAEPAAGLAAKQAVPENALSH